jgi:D-methionine transport system ATP-binding protein
MIEIKGISKSFFPSNKRGKGQKTVKALQNVDLDVKTGEVMGIIGYSGAGKSTLVRCVNLLERPDAGTVIVEGCELTALKEKELRKKRRRIGMVFQHFNLMRSRTVFQNVAYPLFRVMPAAQIPARVKELLSLVGIADKAASYPSQLSGGQKQRAAIARALATKPPLLLCDEATSALDPQATQSILRLLRELNENLSLTILLITHEMAVVKEICDRVAVMDAGSIVERGDVFSVFASPKQKITHDFVNTTSNLSRVEDFLNQNASIVRLKENEELVKLMYERKDVSEAIISESSRRFNVNFNIILGDVEIIRGAPLGGTVSILSGSKADREAVLRHISEKHIKVEVLRGNNN